MRVEEKRKKILGLVVSRMSAYPKVIRPNGYEPSEADLILAAELSLIECKKSCMGVFPEGTFHTAFGPRIEDVRIASYMQLVEDAVRLLVKTVPDSWVENLEEGDVLFREGS